MSEQPLKALFFDTFGTLVEWRASVSEELARATQKALNDQTKTIPADVRQRAEALTSSDWQKFAAEWRKSYGTFTSTFDPSKDEFVSVDQHHYNALQGLLKKRGISGLFDDKELWELAFTWHRLHPWADSSEGLVQLNKKFITSTLSNGNLSLLKDLASFGSLPFTRLTSSEEFGAYKPNPKVYKGAAGIVGLEPSQCGMVAAHLYDLKAAKECGKKDGFVDIWVGLNDGGLLEVARRLRVDG
ncbi:Haloacid dehalogenase type II [Penicillium chermesinum]|nr:Haloacid dehalogenase type II [Penicillium chermesinum]